MCLLFVHIPKNAGGSIKEWFKQNNLNLIHNKHDYLPQIKEKYPTKLYKKSFAVVRNPYHRIISWYVWDEIKAKKMIKKSKNIQQIKIWQGRLEAQRKGILYWLDYVNLSQMGQLDYIKDIDIILRHETLAYDFKIIQDLTNIYKPLDQKNHKLNYNFKDYYSKKYEKKIQHTFEKELEYLKYD